GAEQRRIDIEGAAGDEEPVDPLEIGLDLLRLVRQQERQAAGAGDGAAVILAQGIPGEFRVAAGRLAVERDANNRKRHGDLSVRRLPYFTVRRLAAAISALAAAARLRHSGNDDRHALTNSVRRAWRRKAAPS